MHHSQQHRNYHVIFVYIFKFASLSPLPFEKTTEKGHSNWYSQAVSHASTDQAQPCLTSEIRCVQGGVAVSYRWTSKLALKTQSSLSFDNSFCAAQCSAVTLYLFFFFFFFLIPSASCRRLTAGSSPLCHGAALFGGQNNGLF